MRFRPRRTPPPRSLRMYFAIAAGLLVAAAAAAGPAAASAFTRDLSLDAEQLVLVNMIGAMRLLPAEGDRFEVRIEVQGKDADPDLIRIEVEEGRRARVEVVFPIDVHRDYVYPNLGRGSRTTIREPGASRDDGWFKRLLEGMTARGINVRGSGRGLEVWADVTVLVPGGRGVEARLGAGRIDAEQVDGDLQAKTRSGPVTVKDHRGEVSIDTGSGSVNIERVEGDLHIDTGSGGVVVDRADTERLHVDTGSGGVKARAISTDHATIDTGSGAVVLELDRMGEGSFVIDTGSGGVRLVLPQDASAVIDVRTGSGGIRADIEGAEVTRDGRNRMQLRVGDGKAQVRIDTGSGGVAITGR